MKRLFTIAVSIFLFSYISNGQAPTNQANNIIVEAVSATSTSYTFNWSNGNGGNRIVLVKSANSNYTPIDGNNGNTYPVPNPSYTNLGTDLDATAEQAQLVYDGNSGTSVTVTNLNPSTNYIIAVFEYNGSGATTQYLRLGAANNPITFEYYTATNSWSGAAGINKATVQVWGGGGGAGSGKGDNSNTKPGGGGGGGAYSSGLATVSSPPYSVTVGTGGAGAPASGTSAVTGTDSWFNSMTTIFAQGGTLGKSEQGGGSGGNGGSSGSGHGSVLKNGGNGADSDGSNSSGGTGGGNGGGGGSSGGPDTNGNGHDGSNASNGSVTGGVGNTFGGGDGGAGSNSTSGSPGKFPGGGGGGGTNSSSSTGGAGASGLVIISYTSPTSLVTYSNNPINSTTAQTITVTFSENVTSPTISIATPGAGSVTNAAFTSGSNNVWHYNYTGFTSDGPATVTVGGTSTATGNIVMATPYDNSFTVDNTDPFVSFSVPAVVGRTNNIIPRTGTITSTLASANVTGSGTLFTTELAEGAIIQNGAGTTVGTVKTITDDTHLILTGNAATAVGGAAYTVGLYYTVTFSEQVTSASISAADFGLTSAGGAAGTPGAVAPSGLKRTGTITSTTGSPNVLGIGTLFTTELFVGASIQNMSGVAIGTILSITDDTHLVLASNGSVAVTTGSYQSPSSSTTYTVPVTITTASGTVSTLRLDKTNDPYLDLAGNSSAATFTTGTVAMVDLTGPTVLSSVPVVVSRTNNIIPRTGTITSTVASPNVTGVGTLFTSELAVGAIIKNGVGTTIGTVKSITDDTDLVLTSNAAVAVGGAAYTIGLYYTVTFNEQVSSASITAADFTLTPAGGAAGTIVNATPSSIQRTGTITSTLVSTSVVGVGTLFTTELVIGSIIKDITATTIGTVQSITDDTHLTLIANAAVAVTGGAYQSGGSTTYTVAVNITTALGTTSTLRLDKTNDPYLDLVGNSSTATFTTGTVAMVDITGPAVLSSVPVVVGRTNNIIPRTGTITSTVASPNVTGLGTLFTSELAVGAIIKNAAGTTIGTVKSITDDTDLVLTSNAAVAVGGAAYTVGLYYTVTFNEQVASASITAADFTLTPAGGAAGTIVNATPSSIQRTGTITSTLVSTSVVGVGTLFTTELVIGSIIKDITATTIGTVQSITDDTHLTLIANAAVAVTGGAYQSGGSTTYTVTVNITTALGTTSTLRLDKTANAYLDLVGNSSVATFAAGTVAVVDITAPTVSSSVPVVGGRANNIIPRTGTLTSTSGSTTVTGSGTKFTTELAVGTIVQDGSGNAIGTVQSIADDTDLVLSVNAGSSYSGAYTVGLFYTVTFSEPVTNSSITTADFALTAAGGAAGTIVSVTPVGLPLTGAVTSTIVSPNVAGVGTLFTTQLSIGSILETTGGGAWGTVQSITDDTHLTLTANAGAALTGAAYQAASSTTYTVQVTITTASGTGSTLRLDKNATAYLDVVGNSSSTTFAGGTAAVVDITPPGVTSSVAVASPASSKIPRTGTITSTVVSPNVTGVGTLFTTELAVGAIVQDAIGTTVGTIKTITDDTHLILASNAAVAIGGAAYTVGLYYTVTFSELVSSSSITTADFTLTPGSGATGSIVNVLPSSLQRTGTITSGTGSAAVTGVSTLFTSELAVGTAIQDGTGATIGTVQSITDNTHLTLTANALVAVGGAAYQSGSSVTYTVNVTPTAGGTLRIDKSADQYVDVAGNTSTTTFTGTPATIDLSLPVLTLTLPATNSLVNGTNYATVTYTRTKSLSVGTITWLSTAGTDNGSSYPYSLSGTELTADQTNHPLVGPPTLIDGSTYTITFSGTDLSGNIAIPVSVTGVHLDKTLPSVFSIIPVTAGRINNAIPRTGTITSTSGSNFVSGSSTKFTTELAVGAIVKDGNGNAIGTVQSIADDTDLFLSANAGSSYSGAYTVGLFYTVTFSESVTNSSITTADFALTAAGGAAGTIVSATPVGLPLTGTVTSTIISPNVTGAGTLFTTELSIGSILETTGGGAWGTVQSITDDTHLTLTVNAGTILVGAAYQAASSTTYTVPVTITAASGVGSTLRLDKTANAYLDVAGNSSTNTFTTGAVAVVDITPPVVSSSIPIVASQVNNMIPRTGTITSTVVSASVTGVGTLFTTELAVGAIVQDAFGTVIGTVQSITDDTHLTLTSNAAVAVGGAAYTVGLYYTVTFNKQVSGASLTTADFALTSAGGATGTIGTVTPSNIQRTGTITSTVVSPNIVGVGTLFTTELTIGSIIQNTAGATIGVVQSITDDTHLSLVVNAAVAVVGGSYQSGGSTTYTVTVNITTASGVGSTLRLDKTSDSYLDIVGNSSTATFTTGAVAVVDITAPTVSSSIPVVTSTVNNIIPRTGTITSTLASASVTGVGTLFTTELAVGAILKNAAGTTIGTVKSITDDTDLVITANAAVAVGGAAYTVGLYYTVTFNEQVTSASITTADFALTSTGGAAGTIGTVTPSSIQRTGTITSTLASASVTGVGTLFTTELAIGSIIQNAAGTTIGTVKSITDDTHLTLAANAAVAVAGGAYQAPGGSATYTVTVNITTASGVGSTLRLDKTVNGYLDLTGNSSAATFTSGTVAVVDISAPTVSSSIPAVPSPVNNIIPRTGTVTSSVVSANVTGVGTLFTTELAVGAIIKNAAGTTIGTVQSIANNTNLTLTSNAAVAVGGAAYAVGLYYTVTFNKQVTSASITTADFGLTSAGGAAGTIGTVTPSSILRTGTVTSTLASANVVGVGTLFTTELTIGSVIQNTAGTTIGTVQSIADNTHLALTSNAAVAVAGGAYQAPGGSTTYTVTATITTGSGVGSTLRLDKTANAYLDLAGNSSAATFTTGTVAVVDIAAPTVSSSIPVVASPVSNVIPRAGTITSTVVSTSVTGVSTLFTTELAAGAIIKNAAGTTIGTVQSIADDTHLTLTSNAAIAVGGAAYTVGLYYTVTFSEPVTNGSITTADFALTAAGGAAGTIVSATPVGLTLTGTVTSSLVSPNVVGVGTLFTTQLSIGSILETTGGGAWGTVQSITDDTHLTLAANAGAALAGTAYQAGSSTTYTVPVIITTASGVGSTLRLDKTANAYLDLAGNSSVATFTTGTVATVDLVPPTVSSIVPALGNNGPSGIYSTSTLTYNVTFSESVSNVAFSDFTLTSIPAAGATGFSKVTGAVTGITGSGTSYVVTVTGVTGTGNLRLDMPANASVIDLASNGNVAGFNSGTPYSVILPPTSNNITALTSSNPSTTSIKLNWTSPTGVQLPTHILVVGILHGSGAFPTVANGTLIASSGNWNTAGSYGATIVDYSTGIYPAIPANDNVTIGGLLSGQQYDFNIYPYTLSPNNVSACGCNSNVDYNTTGTQSISATVTTAAATTITADNNPAPFSPISSLTNTLTPVFSFHVVDDGGASADNAPTLITQIVINAGGLNTVTNWSSVIASASLIDLTQNPGSPITVGSANITANTITFPLTYANGNPGYIAENATKEYQLQIALKTSLPTTADTQSFDFLVSPQSTSRTGTITTTLGSTSVTGVGTLFTTELAVGSIIQNGVGTVIGTVQSITNNTSLTLTANAALAVSSAAYTIPGFSYGAQFDPRLGTITSTLGSTSVTGIGTFFNTELAVGSLVQNAGGSVIGVVQSISSNTSLTLTANAAVSVANGAYTASSFSSGITSSTVAVGQSQKTGAEQIQVLATGLAFTTQPTLDPGASIPNQNQYVLTNFTSNPVVMALDKNGNLDLDVSGSVYNITITNAAGIAMNPGTTTSLLITPAAGIANFPVGFQYTDLGNGTLTATGINESLASINSNSSSTGAIAGSTVTVIYDNATTINSGTAPNAQLSSINTSGSNLVNKTAPYNAFTFNIKDDNGSGGDGAPTLVDKIIITPSGADQFPSQWSQMILGATLVSVNNPADSIAGTVNTYSLTFSSSPSTLPGTLGTIADNGTETYALYLKFKTNLGTLHATADNLNFGFTAQDVNITLASSHTSSFASSQSTSASAAFDVEATQLKFTTEPDVSYLVNVPMSAQTIQPIVEAVDVNLNRDLDYGPPNVPNITTTTTVVGEGSQPTTLTSAPNGGLISGTTFGNMQFTTVGVGATIQVHSGVNNLKGGIVADAISSAFNVTAGTATTLSNPVTIGSVASTSTSLSAGGNSTGATQVFSFQINEDGGVPPALDDGNPTLVTQITFTQSSGGGTNNTNTITDWTQAIVGATLSDGVNTIQVTTATVGAINSNSIVFSGISFLKPRTGTITSLTSSPNITGIGTLFTTELSVGSIILNALGVSIGTVQSITDNTHLVLNANAAIAVIGGNYTIYGDLGYIPDGGPNGIVGSHKTYTLSIWLNTALGGTLPITIDQLKFGFDATQTNISTDQTGTSIEPGQQALSTTGNAVNVVATKINYLTLAPASTPALPPNTSAFSAVPSPAFASSAYIYTPFNGTTSTIGMEAVDVNGNRDLGFTGTISAFGVANSLTFANDPIATGNKTFANGTFSFDPNFQYTSANDQTVAFKDGSITVSTTTPTLSSQVSTPISVSASVDSYVYFDPSFAAQTFNNFVNQQSGSLPATADATVANMAQFIVSDGGAANFFTTSTHTLVPDADKADTKIRSLTFAITSVSGGLGDIKKLAIYDNAGNKVSASDQPISLGSLNLTNGYNTGTVTFTFNDVAHSNNPYIAATDDNLATFSIRGTFSSSVYKDGDDIQFKITAATWDIQGSQVYPQAASQAPFVVGVSGGSSSPVSIVDVIATSLDFTVQPSAYAGLNEPVGGTDALVGSIVGGSGYTDGTYTGVQVSISSGVATTAPIVDIVVAGGKVTNVSPVTLGQSIAGNTTYSCSAALIGGTGSGWSITVAATPYSYGASGTLTSMPVTMGGVVAARDKFANIDTGFSPTTISLKDASGNVATLAAGAAFTHGILNLNGMVYNVAVGNQGAITVGATTTGAAPYLATVTSPAVSSGNAIACSTVNVLDVTASLTTNGSTVPPAQSGATNLKGGVKQQNIFGLNFSAVSTAGSEPQLKGFTINFDVPYQTSSTKTFNNFTLQAQYITNSGSVTTNFTASNGLSTGSSTNNSSLDEIILTLPSPISLVNSGNSVSFFLLADVDASVNSATPKITPYFTDGGYGQSTDQNTIVSNGTAVSVVGGVRGVQVLGTQYGFASTKPPVLLTTKLDGTVPYSGQDNVDPNLKNITLQFDTNVGSLDAGGNGHAELWMNDYPKNASYKVADLKFDTQTLQTWNGNQAQTEASVVTSGPLVNTVNNVYPYLYYDISLLPGRTLIADSVYFVKLIQGNYDATVGAGVGIVDLSLNLYGGISTNSVLYFKISSSQAPKLSFAASTFNTTTLGSLTTNFDQFGTAFYTILNSATTPTPTATQVFAGSYPGAIASGSYPISVLNSNQTVTFPASLTAGHAYDIYLVAQNDAFVNGVSAPVKSTGVYGGSSTSPAYGAGLLPGPTTTIPASGAGSVSVSSNYVPNQNSFLICPDSYTILNSPLVVGETSGINFSYPTGDQTFNILLPTGFQFDVTVAPVVQLEGPVTAPGGNFNTLVSLASQFGNSHSPTWDYKYASNTLLTISFNNSSTVLTDVQDYILVSGLSVKGVTGSNQGNISWFFGINIFSLNYSNPVFTLATIALQNTKAPDFNNSYWLANRSLFNAIEPVNGADPAAGAALDKTVNTIPDNYVDKNFPGQIQLLPDPRTLSDYLASTFSGSGVSGDLFTLNAVATGSAFNIVMDHTDLNGCTTQTAEQYLVYNHKNPISNKLGTAYPSPSTSAGTQQAIVNTNWPSAASAIMSPSLNDNELAGYKLIQLTADLPSDVIPNINPTPGNPLMSGSVWRNLIQNNILTTSSVPYSWDYSAVLNASSSIVNSTKAIGNYAIGTSSSQVYDYFKSPIPTPSGNNYWIGGSLGKVEFTGVYQSTADVSVYTPFRQDVELFVPSIPVLETSAGQNPDKADNTTGKGGVSLSSLGSIGQIYPGGYPGTSIFCEHSGVISISGYPLATPGVSGGLFSIYDYSSYDFNGIIVPTGITITTSITSNTVGVQTNNLTLPSIQPGATLFDPLGNIIGSVASSNGIDQITLSANALVAVTSSAFRFNNNTPLAYAAPGSGFVDAGNGTMTLDPLQIKNFYNDILVSYTYQDLNSPAFGTGYLVVRVTPNPDAQFKMASITGVGNPASAFKAFCLGNPINFDAAPSTIAQPTQSGSTNKIANYTWNFGDPNSGANRNAPIDPSLANQQLGGGAGQSIPVTYVQPLPANQSQTFDMPQHYFNLSQQYTITLQLRSNWGCLSSNAASTVSPTIQATNALVQGWSGQITVGEIPTVDFSFLGNCVGDQITFTDNSATSGSTSSGTVAKFDWQFGDGITFTGFNTTLSPSAPFNFINSPDGRVNVAHVYTTPNSYNVTLTTTTDLGCFNSASKSLSQLPVVVPSQSSAFAQDFNATNGGWIALNISDTLSAPAVGGTSWTWDGSKWTTSNPYKQNEKSALYSACLDLSTIPRPVIAFDSYIDLTTGEGLVIQYSSDTKNIQDASKSWAVLGTTNVVAPGAIAYPGLDWYNSSGLPSNPGSSTLNPSSYGWSEINTTLQPKHELEDIGKNNRVILRYALSTLNAGGTGVSVDNVFVGSRTRTVLLENFTTTDGGSTSVNAAVQTDAGAIDTFVNANLSSTQIVNINYHVGFLGPDPFNMDNPADPSARALYYNINQVPYAFLDGKHSANKSASPQSDSSLFANWGQGAYDLQTLNLAKADFLDASNQLTTVTTANVDGSVQVDVNVTPRRDLAVGPGGTALFIAVLEKQITQLPKTGSIKTGETQFSYVLKKMLPNAAGTPITVPLTAGSPVSLGTLKWIPEKLYSNVLTVVVFLQNVTTKEVYQAEIFDNLTAPPTVTEVSQMNADNVKVYPNPVDKEFTVVLPNPATQTTSIQIADQLGRIIDVGAFNEGEQTKTVNTQGLSAGMYILMLGNNGSAVRTKIIVVHK